MRVRLPRVRFTVRRMMVVVAVVGLFFYGVVLRSRSMERAKRAELLRTIEEYHRAVAEWASRVAKDAEEDRDAYRTMMSPENIERAELSERNPSLLTSIFNALREVEQRVEQSREVASGRLRTVAHYARLRAKYEHAARYPWLSVEPDPPPPD